MKFIHDNYVDFIMTTNNEEFKVKYEQTFGCSPPKKLPYGIVWKGKKIVQDFDMMIYVDVS